MSQTQTQTLCLTVKDRHAVIVWWVWVNVGQQPRVTNKPVEGSFVLPGQWSWVSKKRTHWTLIFISVFGSRLVEACSTLRSHSFLAGLRYQDSTSSAALRLQLSAYGLRHCPEMTSLWSTSKSQVPRSSVVPHSPSGELTLPPPLFPSLHSSSSSSLSPMTSPSFYPGCSSNVLLLVPLPGAWMSSVPFRNQVIGVISITQAWALVAMQMGPGLWWLL